MKRFVTFFVALVFCLPAMSQDLMTIPDGAQSMPLIAGGGNPHSGVEVGRVFVWLDDSVQNLCVQYDMYEGFCLMEVHLDVEWNWMDFPMTRSGNPKVGHFAYTQTGLDCVPAWKKEIPLEDLVSDDGVMPGPQSVICIAAHAVTKGEDKKEKKTETAWAGDQEFPGRSWATYFCLMLPPPENPPVLGVEGALWWDCNNNGIWDKNVPNEPDESPAYRTAKETGEELVAVITLVNTYTGGSWTATPDEFGYFSFLGLGIPEGPYMLIIQAAQGAVGLSPQASDPALNEQDFVPDSAENPLVGSTVEFNLQDGDVAYITGGLCGST